MGKRDFSDVPYILVGTLVAVQEEIEKIAEGLVAKGKSMTPEGRKKVSAAKKGLVSRGDEFSKVVGKTVQRVLENSGLVTRNDMEDIERRVSEMEKKSTPRKKAAKKATAKKATGKKAAVQPLIITESPVPGPEEPAE